MKNADGVDFNSFFMSGEHFAPDILKVLMHFRVNRFVAVADIHKFFYQTALNEKTGAHDLIRFWYKFEGEKEFSAYRAKRLTFGHISAPSQAHFSVLKLCEKYEEELPLATDCLMNYMYVDDVADCDEDEDVVIKTMQEINTLLPRASMKLTKIASNSKRLIKEAKITEEMRSQKAINGLLGIPWKTDTDVLIMSFSKIATDHIAARKQLDGSGKFTFRDLASLCAVQWDPLGFVSAPTLLLKLLQREGWKRNYHWNQTLDEDLQSQVTEWLLSALKTPDLEIPRYVPIKKWPFDLLTFVDASHEAAAIVIFARIDKGDEITTQLLMSKTRVTPLKKKTLDDYDISISRHELLSMVLGVKCWRYMKSLLEVQPRASYFFTDSSVSWWRLQSSPEKHRSWVANRLRYCLEYTSPSQWFPTPGTLNTADVATRRILPHKFAALQEWWRGPYFVRKNVSDWPKQPKALTPAEAKIKEKIDAAELISPPVPPNMVCFVTPSAGRAMPLDSLVGRFEKWSKIVRVLTYFLRFLVHILPSLPEKSPLFRLFVKHPRKKGWPSTSERRACTLMLHRRSQQRAFAADFREDEQGGYSLRHGSKLAQFAPFVDECNIIRATTRLQLADHLDYAVKCPIILPAQEVSRKFIVHLHVSLGHAPKGVTYYSLISEFLLLGGRREAYKYIHTCTTRGCQAPIPLRQPFAQLPESRCDIYSVWMTIGIDVMGPIYAKVSCPHGTQCPLCEEQRAPASSTRAAKKKNHRIKRWVLTFSCFSTRSVHYELLLDGSVLEIMNAYIRMTSRKGTPRHIFSDQAPAFRKADQDLRRLYRNIDWDALQEKTAEDGVEWTFNPPYYSKGSGVYERQHLNAREALQVALRDMSLSDRELETQLAAAEAIVNSRPILAPGSGDDWNTVSPAELVSGRRLKPLPYCVKKLLDVSPQDIPLAKLHRQRKEILSKFCSVWQKQYLQSLSINFRNRTPGNVKLKVGDPVLLKEKSIGRGTWCIARIHRIHSSADGRIRTVDIVTPNHQRPIERSIHDLAYLEGSAPFRGPQNE